MNILAVDISALFSQYWEVDSGKGRDFDAPRQSTINAVRRWRDGHDRVAICCDSGKSFRSQIWDTYKANRPDRGEAYRNQIRLTVEALATDGCSVFHAPKYGGELYAEADDVIGSLCSWAFESGHQVTILSNDKDLMQLVSDSVVMIRPLAKDGEQKVDSAVVQAKLGIVPHLVPPYLGKKATYPWWLTPSPVTSRWWAMWCKTTLAASVVASCWALPLPVTPSA